LATFNTPGQQTLTATDTANPSLTGGVTVTVDAAPVATHFLVFPVPPDTVGSASLFYVAVLDAAYHPVPNYAGTAHFTSTDAAAQLPADYTFQAGDRGVHKFLVTFNTSGKQTVTATDVTIATLTGSATVKVGSLTGFLPFDLSQL